MPRPRKITESASSADLDFSEKSVVDFYKELPKPLKKQISALEDTFENDKEIGNAYKKLYSTYGKKYKNYPKIKKILFRIALYRVISPDFLFEKKYYPHVFAYDGRGHSITLKKSISIGKHVFVIAGLLDNDQNIPMVLKWYKSGSRDTSFEVEQYAKLRGLNCPLPWFSSTYEFWGSPVLVIEKLESLGPEDDEFKVGIEVIKQLLYVHQIGIHNDIKPGNVMKRMENGKAKYFIIDYGGVATKRLGHGYQRWIWSPKWTCQDPHEERQITTPKHDFIELGYTMKTLQNWTTKDTAIRENFSGKLLKYMNCVNVMDERNITKQDYKNLITILDS